ncbi:MAG: hypothetical protein PHE02_02075 [Lachnospiraceae bacterium]|nr:hypothetical protein [Lachnospiraceae bacterium]
MVFFYSGRCGGTDRAGISKRSKHLLGGYKKHLKEGGADQLLTNCKQLKMVAADGKNLRIIVAKHN